MKKERQKRGKKNEAARREKGRGEISEGEQWRSKEGGVENERRRRSR